MQWSNLNEQMIEQFFQNSNSPSNAEISLNFTRTSRQMGSNQKPHKEISPKIEIQNPQHQQKPINPENDIFAFANKEISNFDSWIKGFNSNKQKLSSNIDSQWQAIEKQLSKPQNPSKSPKNSSLQNSILSKFDQLSKKVVNLSFPKPCQHCILSENKIFELQTQLKQVQSNLQAKTLQLTKINEKQIKELGYQISFEVENRLLNDRVDELMSKNVELCETIQAKNHEINKLSEEINKYQFEKSNFLSRTKALQTRQQQMQKSKSFMMSAAKNSTSHSEFNITNQAMLNKSQNQTNIDTTLIHTNQFSTEKPTADEYCIWFDKLKQVYLEKYKKEEKEHLKKFPELKNNEIGLKMEINNFKKGSARYEVARSWNNIANYVSKNKENFLQLISNEIGSNIKIPSFEGSNNNLNNSNKENVKIVEYLEEELKKSQKKAQGHLSQIENLNQQLMIMKKTLLKEKEEKTKLSRQVNELNEEIQEIQHQLDYTRQKLQSQQYTDKQSPAMNKKNNIANSNNSESDRQSPCIELVQQLQENLIELQKQLCIKSEQLKNVIYELKGQQQSQLKLSQSIKQCQRLLHKERLQKIHYFKQSLPSQPVTTACRIRAKSINEKKLPSVLHEFQSRVYVDKDKISYKFDLFEQTGKKSTDQIYPLTKKILTNCLYQPTSSLILSMGSTDSEFREYFRGESGLVWSSITEMYKLKFTEKRFLAVDIALSIVEINNSQFIDMMDSDKRKKVTLKKQGDQVTFQNCLKLQFETQQQAKSALNQTYSKQHQLNSHLITIVEFTITDKRNKQKFTSKLYFAQIHLENSSGQHNETPENLTKDTKALWNVFKCMNFKQPFQTDSNRLTCLFSECFHENSKNLMIINVSPSEIHKQNSLFSLNYASSLKYLATEKPQSLIRYTQKTPEHSVSKLKHNSSHSLIQTPTLNPDSFEQKNRSITKHRNSSSEHTIYVTQNAQKKKRTISRLSIC